MFGFSCFSSAQVHFRRPKKTVEPSVEAMQKSSEDFSQVQALSSESQGDEISKPAGSAAFEHCQKSEDVKGEVGFGRNIEAHHMMHLKKSQSLGNELYLKGRTPVENDADIGIVRGFSSDSLKQNSLVVQHDNEYTEGRPPSLYQEAPNSESVQVGSYQFNNGSIFSVEDPYHSEKETRQLSDSSLSGDQVDCSGNHTSHNPRVIVRSSSSPNILESVPASGGYSPFKYISLRARSFDDLQALDMKWKENSVHKVDPKLRQEQEIDDGVCRSENNNVENFLDDGCDSYHYSSVAKDWIIPVIDEGEPTKPAHGEPSARQRDELPSKDFRIKRIEEWVNDLQHCSLPEEANEISDYNGEVQRESTGLNAITNAEGDKKLSPEMEAAKKYISLLSASATTAQLVNNGLVVIPFLSAFASLRVLNLSGNAIVRITAGALPRGLHALNLSKNNISTIEGLRELTRLRVLDLRYNRILRIGHGLASCSSLKELYLAGNRISEIEGLHRLLKLTVLDLRFNKISTTKCLGQLAANYDSLQAISLEGNPAQKNVGDEQLKKYLQGLLPKLAYFNRLSMKTSSLKDTAERSVRLGIGTHQLDRSHRSELKPTRKSSHSTSAHRPSPSAAATQGRKHHVAGSPMRSRARHGRLPPTGISGTAVNQHHHNLDVGNRLLNLRSELSMRRSRSEGTLGVL